MHSYFGILGKYLLLPAHASEHGNVISLVSVYKYRIYYIQVWIIRSYNSRVFGYSRGKAEG